MKNRKLTAIVSLVLAIVMLCSSIPAAAFDIVPTGTPTTEAGPIETTTAIGFEPTTAPADETTTAPADETTTLPEDETTTEPTTEDDRSEDYWDGYEDGYEDGYDEGYDEGFWDGYYDYDSGDDYYEGYYDGYYNGYYEGLEEGRGEVITIFDRWDAFRWDFMERIEMFKIVFVEFFQRIFRTGDFAVIDPAEIEDTSFIPDGTQTTLEDDEEAAALCEEFNTLINGFIAGNHPDVKVTRRFDTIVNLIDCTGGPLVKNIAQKVIDNNIVQNTREEYYYEGYYAYLVQETNIYPSGLTVAEKTVNEDGTTDYKFVLAEEACFFDGYDTYAVRFNEFGDVMYSDYYQHDEVAYTLYVEYIDAEPAAVTRAEIQYPGATITAKTDAEGRLVTYDIEMPVKGAGEAKISFIKASVELEGESNMYFDFEYDF